LFSERLQSALVERSAAFLAADSQLRSRAGFDDNWEQYANGMGLESARQVSTRSMVFGEQNMALVDLRAVSDAYPLKGDVKVLDTPFGQQQVATSLPTPGNVWIDSRLFQLLDVELGDSVYVGDETFTVERVLGEIPDAGFSVFNTDPIVLMPLQNLHAANVTGPGSRVLYKTYFVGEESTIKDYFDWLRPKLDDEIHGWRSLADDNSPIGESVARAEQYFLLASLLAIVLAAVSIAVAAQRYSQRHFDPVAIMKTLGATKSMIQKVYVLQITFIMVLGILLGLLVGFAIQQVVVLALAEAVDVSLSVWHWRPVLIATFTGALCAFMFSIYPLLQLFSVPPLRVLRRDIDSTLSARWLQFLAAGTAIFALMWAYSGDVKISAIMFVSGIVLVAGLILVTYGLIALGRKLGQGSMGPWQLAWARIRRRAMDNSVQLISFSVTIMLLLVVLVMRNDMIEQWRSQLPEGTPNYFVINITDDKKQTFIDHFSANNVELTQLYPVVRGRFVAINDEQVNTEFSKEEESSTREGRDGLGREANLTWGLALQKDNKVTDGVWHAEWSAPASSEVIHYPVSVEKELAGRLGLNMGDKLQFNVGSQIVNTEITSLREVNWQSMQPNFFFVLHPAAMEAFSPTYLTSFHLDTEQKPILTSLLQPFPAVTLFDVDARINQLRSIVDQVSMAVEFILVLVLAAGSLVLIAQVQASMDERQQELAILRTLGAKGSLIRQSVVFEFFIIGIVAGLMAAIANEFSLYMLQTQVFQMEPGLHLDYWGIASGAGAIVVSALGAISCWRLLSLNTTTLLRRMV
jgi:putative ABC transport system permease protein